MINSKLYPQFLSSWLRQKKHSEGGFTLTEALVAIIVLTIAFTINLQFLVALRIKNLEQEIETAAVSIAGEIMDDIRFQLQSDLTNQNYPLGLSTQTGISRSGYDFEVDIFVCNNQPNSQPTITTINNNQVVANCNELDTPDSGIRYVVVQVVRVINENRQNEILYTVQNAFTILRQRQTS